MMSLANVDRISAKEGFDLVGSLVDNKVDPKKIEINIRKSLGILEENGVFAFFIHLEAKGKKGKDSLGEEKCGRLIYNSAVKLLSNFIDPGLQPKNDNRLLTDETLWNSLCKEIRNKLKDEAGLVSNIYQMFLIKDILSRELTYALYRARALGGER